MLAFNSKKHYLLFMAIVLIVAVFVIYILKNDVFHDLNYQADQPTLECLQVLFPEARYYIVEDDIYKIYKANKYRIGYAYFAKGMGFRGLITILVGLEDRNTIKGISIISHSETTGSAVDDGPPIDFSLFVNQFINLRIDDCDLKKYNGLVDSITGSTRSSKAIVDIVRESAIEKVKYIN